MTPEEQKQLFDTRQAFTLSVPLSDISHYTTMTIHWQALHDFLADREQWVAYKMTGYEYVDNRLRLTFTCKAFAADEGTNEAGDPLRYCLPEYWHSCDYTSE